MRRAASRLSEMRKLLSKYGISAYIVPSSDAHQSEYVASCDMRRGWISGFDGSAGTAVITNDKALLWTDARYFLQAQQQLTEEWTLMKQGQPSVPTIESWLANNVPDSSKVGIDPYVTPLSSYRRLLSSLQGRSQIVAIEENLVDVLWLDRPPQPRNEVFLHPSKYTVETVLEWAAQSLKPNTISLSGQDTKAKLEAVRAELKKEGAAALVVTASDEVAWLFNLRGSDVSYNPVFMAYAIVSHSTTILFIDKTRMTKEAVTSLEDEGIELRTYSSVVISLSALSSKIESLLEKNGWNSKGHKIWIDSLKCNMALYNAINQRFSYSKESPIALLKSVKNKVEVEGMRQSHLRDAVAMCCFLYWMDNLDFPSSSSATASNSLNEISVAQKLEEFRSKQKDFMGLSFETISSSGPNGAIIHYSPKPETARAISNEEVYLFDSGAQYRDGTTDVTRTIHLGTPTKFERSCFTRVLQGHMALAAAVFPPGTVGPTLDVLARLPLWQDGLEYGHGTGHGVGAFLNVHEGPQGISSSLRQSSVLSTPLQAGMTTSNEPGYYHMDDEKNPSFGIRIESVMVVKNAETKHKYQGKQFLEFETLTMVPIQLKMLDMSLLTKTELLWLNNYHLDCLRKVGPLLKEQGLGDVLQWLVKATQPLVID